MDRRLALTVLGLAMLAAGCVSFNTPSPAPDYQIPHQLTPGTTPTASDAESRGPVPPDPNFQPYGERPGGGFPKTISGKPTGL